MCPGRCCFIQFRSWCPHVKRRVKSRRPASAAPTVECNMIPHRVIAGITTFSYLREAANQQVASNHVTPMWQFNVSDFPQRVFKASSLWNLLKFLIKRLFINWQMYMRSIYWQAMQKVKKKSDKQRQRLDKVRKKDERATNEKEVQAKTCIEKLSILSVDVHVTNNNLGFCCYICICCLKLHQAD